MRKNAQLLGEILCHQHALRHLKGQHERQLGVQVERYIYFPADAKRLGAKTCLLELGKEESTECGQLSIALGCLRELHRKFYTGELTALLQQILSSFHTSSGSSTARQSAATNLPPLATENKPVLCVCACAL